MERFYTGIVIGIPFPAEGMYHPPAVQVSLKGLACVLASQITMDEDSLRLLHIQTGIFYCLHCQFCRHGQTISISDNLTAVQVHHTSQIGPAFPGVYDRKQTFQERKICMRPQAIRILALSLGTVSWFAWWLYFFTTTDLSPWLAICLWTRLTLQGIPLLLRI